jgi:hypothetical protein
MIIVQIYTIGIQNSIGALNNTVAYNRSVAVSTYIDAVPIGRYIGRTCFAQDRVVRYTVAGYIIQPNAMIIRVVYGIAVDNKIGSVCCG